MHPVRLQISLSCLQMSSSCMAFATRGRCDACCGGVDQQLRVTHIVDRIEQKRRGTAISVSISRSRANEEQGRLLGDVVGDRVACRERHPSLVRSPIGKDLLGERRALRIGYVGERFNFFLESRGDPIDIDRVPNDETDG